MASILLVDDDEQLRPMLKMVLERAGHVVNAAGNGKEALVSYSLHPTELVVTDLVMPDKEGLETIRELRRTYPDLKIIAMSGGGRTGVQNYLELAVKFGANHILNKPFSNQELLDGVQMLVSARNVELSADDARRASFIKPENRFTNSY
ncbi:MAG: response regulator [Pyrinomonadaceae bacterium]